MSTTLDLAGQTKQDRFRFFTSVVRRYTMRAASLALLVAVPGLSLAQPPGDTALAAVQALAAKGTEPMIAESSRTATTQHAVAAVVQLTAHTAAIAIAGEVEPGVYEIVARSRPFHLSRESNFGAWVEEFRFNAPDRIELSFTARGGCANKSLTHRFALRNDVWLVVGLDEFAMRCTDNGVEPDWTESSNYLTGEVVRTTFSRSKPGKTTHERGTRRSFPLSEFPPTGPEAVYAEMQ
jgi:hypothetical protein